METINSTATDLLVLLTYAKEQVADLNKTHDEASMLYHSVEEKEKGSFEKTMNETKGQLEVWTAYLVKLEQRIEERIQAVVGA